MSNGVVTDDRVWKALKRRMLRLGRMGVRVGVLSSGKGNDQHPDGKGKFTMLELAATQHFGSPKKGIPPRPFITQAIEANRKEQAEVTRALLKRVMAGVGGLTNKHVMNTLGVWGTNIVKNHVKSGPPMKPPNAQSTVDTKGSSRPLIRHSHMINSITHEVQK